jgi:hypothetical protein
MGEGDEHLIVRRAAAGAPGAYRYVGDTDWDEAGMMRRDWKAAWIPHL